MNLCIFEDRGYRNLLPLTYFRPVYDLRCGILTLKEKILRLFPDLDVTLHCRDYLQDVIREENPEIAVNTFHEVDYLFINGRILPELDLKTQINMTQEAIYQHEGNIIAAVIKAKNIGSVQEKMKSDQFFELPDNVPAKKISAHILKYPWDFIHCNAEQIEADFKDLYNKGFIEGNISDSVSFLNKNNIVIAKDAVVKPGVVLDAEHGPVIIDQGAEVMPQATIIGPAYIGPKSIVKIGAKIYEGTSAGQVCKLGGEVEESIIHSYSNKQHDGFLGHAYLGQWINIGADTNNSDLKNNYGTVKVTIDNKIIDTGSIFVGSTIGDHSKTGINTMLNTGTVIGVFSNVFGSGFPPKYMPSYCWGGAETMVEYQLENAISTAKKVLERRKKELTPCLEKLYRKVFTLTQDEREKIITRQRRINQKK